MCTCKHCLRSLARDILIKVIVHPTRNHVKFIEIVRFILLESNDSFFVQSSESKSSSFSMYVMVMQSFGRGTKQDRCFPRSQCSVQ